MRAPPLDALGSGPMMKGPADRRRGVTPPRRLPTLGYARVGIGIAMESASRIFTGRPQNRIAAKMPREIGICGRNGPPPRGDRRAHGHAVRRPRS